MFKWLKCCFKMVRPSHNYLHVVDDNIASAGK